MQTAAWDPRLQLTSRLHQDEDGRYRMRTGTAAVPVPTPTELAYPTTSIGKTPSSPPLPAWRASTQGTAMRTLDWTCSASTRP